MEIAGSERELRERALGALVELISAWASPAVELAYGLSPNAATPQPIDQGTDGGACGGPRNLCGGGECLYAAVLALSAGHEWGVAVLGEDGRAQPLNALAAELLTVVGDDPRLGGERRFTVRDVEVRPVPPAAAEPPTLVLLRDLGQGRAAARLFGVTEQEHRTLRHLHDGRTATEAARRMGLSPTTVRGYIASLHRKLEAGHTAALLRRGRDLGLLTD